MTDAVLSVEEALALLPEGEKIHTFLDTGPVLVGAHWDRADVEELIRSTDRRRVTGPEAQSMGHGLALWGGDCEWVYVETR